MGPVMFALALAGLAWVLVVISPQIYRPLMLLIGVWATLGVKKTPGRYGRAIDALWFAAALAGLGWPAMLAVACIALHLTWQIIAVDLDDPADCLAKFRANRWIGWLLLAGILGGQLLP